MPATVYAVSEGAKFAGDTTLVVVCCNSCHITYAIPQSLDNAMLRWRGDKPNGWKTTCPMGHTWWYVGETQVERAERIAAEARQRLQATRDLLHAEERSHAATKGHLTRTKKRIAGGVCPCCNRTFTRLGQHMQTKHPEYGGGNAAADPPATPSSFEVFHRQDPRIGDGPLPKKLLALLAERPRRFVEIRQELDITNGHTSNLLYRMLGYGLIERVSRGLYKKADAPVQ